MINPKAATATMAAMPAPRMTCQSGREETSPAATASGAKTERREVRYSGWRCWK